MPLACRTRRPTPCLLALAAIVCGLGTGHEGSAQEPEGIAPADTAEVSVAATEPPGGVLAADTRRHPHRFGLAVHGLRQFAVHVVKNEEYNINDITESEWALDGGLRWFAMDALSLNVRYMRGGLGISDRPEDLARFDDLRGDEFIKLDGFVFAVNAYLGNKLFPRNRINPYLLFSVSRMDWALNKGGRDGEPYTILEKPLEGTDLGVGAGLGVEYPLPTLSGLALELEWVWHYVLTEDDQPGTLDHLWTNTHFWNLGAGLAWNF